MMQGNLGFVFDANQIDPSEGPSQLPVGTHPLQIIGSKYEEGKVYLTFEVFDGPERGARGNQLYNIHYNGPDADKQAKTRQIAMGKLSAVAHVTGIKQFQDTSQLHGGRLIAVIVNQKDNPQYTEIQRVTDLQGNPPRSGGNQAAPQQNQQPQYQNQGQPQQGQYQGGQPQYQQPGQQPQYQPQGGYQQNPPSQYQGGQPSQMPPQNQQQQYQSQPLQSQAATGQMPWEQGAGGPQ